MPSGAFVAINIAYQVWFYRGRRTLRERAEAAEYTLCTRCAYDISSLERSRKEGPDGRHVRCPECGTLVDAREARILWREYLTR